MNNAAMNIFFISLGWIIRSGVAKSYCNFVLNIIRNHSTVFCRGFTVLQLYQQRRSDPMSLNP